MRGESGLVSSSSLSASLAKAAKKHQENADKPEPIILSEVLLTGLWKDPLTARSRTSERLGHIDFGMVVPPVRAFIYCMICPYLAYPVAVLQLYGYVRCLRTTVLPKYYRRQRYHDHVMYGVQRRTYDEKQRRLLETQIDDVLEIQNALRVVKGARNQFVDDPNKSGTAYLVVEQKIMKAEAIFTGENWAWAFVADSCRYLGPVGIACMFHPSCKRLTVDISLWLQNRIRWSQIRHPLLNFFKSYNEYNKSMQRINVVKPAPKGSSPWSKNL